MIRHRFTFGIMAGLVLLSTAACLLLPFYPLPEKTRQPLVFAPDALPSAIKGVPYEAEITISQTETPVIDFYILKGALPDGLTIEHVEHENTAKITGIPTEEGSFTFEVTVQCYGTSVSGQSGSREYTIQVEK